MKKIVVKKIMKKMILHMKKIAKKMILILHTR